MAAAVDPDQGKSERHNALPNAICSESDRCARANEISNALSRCFLNSIRRVWQHALRAPFNSRRYSPVEQGSLSNAAIGLT
jgi:hypothetical protein